jgi:hypothetical protein
VSGLRECAECRSFSQAADAKLTRCGRLPHRRRTTTWPYVAFKGGSEPGVLILTWLLTHSDGRSFMLSIVLNDSAKIDEAAS